MVDTKKQNSKLMQYLATLAVSFSALSCGVNQGWSSPYLPSLLSANSTIPTTNAEGSWIAVMSFLGAPPGAIFAAMTIDLIGRKSVILLMAPITLACFIGLAYAPSILLICILRFVIGSVEGALFTAIPIYLAEIAEPEIRGILGSAISVACIFGVIFINIVGSCYSIFVTSYVCALFPIVHVAMFAMMPESPYYYCKRQDYDRAQKSLERLRSGNNVDEEMKQLVAAVKRQESQSKGRFTDMFMVRSNRKACYIYIILSCTNKITGKSPLTGYTMTVFEKSNTDVDATLSVVIFNVVGLVAMLLALGIIDKVGRKPLMLISTIGCAVTLFGQSIYFTLLEFAPQCAALLTWMPLICLLTYNGMFNLGLNYGPVLYLSELFPTTVKATALCSADIFAMLLGTATSKFFQHLMDEVDIIVPFWFFAVGTTSAIALVWRFVPETKGKTLEQIQLELLGKPHDTIIECKV